MAGFTYVVQGITLEFKEGTVNYDRDTGTQNIEIVVNTADEQRTQYDVTVEVVDLLTGSAEAGDDYVFSPNPKVLSIPAGAKSGTVHTVTIDIPAGSDDGDETVNLALQNPTLSALGDQDTQEITINGAPVGATMSIELFDNLGVSQGEPANGGSLSFIETVGGAFGGPRLEITNTGAVDLNLSITPSGNGHTGGGLPYDAPTSFVVPPGGKAVLVCPFLASSNFGPGPGTYTTLLTIAHDATNFVTPFLFTFEGTAVY